MFVLNKKGFLIFLFALTFTILIVIIKNNKKSVETMTWSLPVKSIILDAGHGLPDERSFK